MMSEAKHLSFYQSDGYRNDSEILRFIQIDKS
jgi:hypothetical protein